MSADPYKASAGPEDPGSWNRLSFTKNDLVNHTDRTGRFIDPDSCLNLVCDLGGAPVDCFDEFECKDQGGGPPVSLPSQPPAVPQCNIELEAHAVGDPLGSNPTISLPVFHTFLALSIGLFTEYVEGFPSANIGGDPKSFLNASLTANHSLYQSQPVSLLQGYSGTSICADIARIEVAEENYPQDTLGYSILGPNSNSFTHWLVNVGGLSVTALVNLSLSLAAPGWNTALLSF